MTDQEQHNAEPDPLDRIEAEASAYEAGAAGQDTNGGEHLPAAPDDGPGTAEMLEQILGPTFQVIAPNWHVQPSEVRALADAYAGVLDKWLPDGPAQFGPEIAAAMTTLAVFGPRAGVPRHPPRKKAEKGGDKADGGEGQARRNLSDVQQRWTADDDPTAGEARG